MVLIAQISAPDDGLVYSSNNVQLKINEKIIDTGKLYISQDALAWQPNNMPEGISIMWKQISVHGISSDPRKCIYFMLDHKLNWAGVYEGPVRAANGNVGGGGGGDAAMGGAADNCEDEGNETDEEHEDDDEEQMTECWLIPDDANAVDTMFQAMTECQALHPDSADSASDESDFMDDDGEDDDNNGPALGPAGGNGNDAAAAAQGGIQNLHLNDEDRFADAE